MEQLFTRRKRLSVTRDLRATKGRGVLVESVCERLPSLGILLLERIDADAAARCWRIIVEYEWEGLVRQDP